MGFRVVVPCDSNRLAVYIEIIGVALVGKTVEKVVQPAVHIEEHFYECLGKDLHYVLAYPVRDKELSCLGFILSIGIFMVTCGEVSDHVLSISST